MNDTIALPLTITIISFIFGILIYVCFICIILLKQSLRHLKVDMKYLEEKLATKIDNNQKMNDIKLERIENRIK